MLSFSIVGRLLMGWLADRFSKKYVMLLTYLWSLRGIPLLFLGQTRLALYLRPRFLASDWAATT